MESELLRWGASLARHLADPRREALAAVAGSRGCVLADIVPESFGDERGIRIVHRQTGRVLVLAEAAAEGTELRPLVLEIDGTPRVTFEFGLSPARRAGRGVARIKEVKPLRLLLATAAGDATADTLAAELGCDEQVELPDLADRTVAHQVAKLRMEGRRVAVIGAAASVSGSRAAGAVTLAMGLTGPAETLVADVVSLSGDIACVADLLLAASRAPRTDGRSPESSRSCRTWPASSGRSSSGSRALSPRWSPTSARSASTAGGAACFNGRGEPSGCGIARPYRGSIFRGRLARLAPGSPRKAATVARKGEGSHGRPHDSVAAAGSGRG